jgi:hypothetical protein
MRRSALLLLAATLAATLVGCGGFSAQVTPETTVPVATPEVAGGRQEGMAPSASQTPTASLPAATSRGEEPAEAALDCDARPVRMNGPQGDSGIIDYAFPSSFDDLVQHASLIVVARLDTLVQQGHYAGYDDEGKLMQRGGPGNLPFYDYQLKLEQIIYADEEADAAQPVIVRAMEQADETPRQAPQAINIPLAFSARYLLFLGRNPDRQSYGLSYISGRLLIGEDELHFMDGRRTRLLINGQPATLSNIQPCIAALK